MVLYIFLSILLQRIALSAQPAEDLEGMEVVTIPWCALYLVYPALLISYNLGILVTW